MEKNFYSLSFKEQKSELFLEIPEDYDEQKLRKGEFNPENLKINISEGTKTFDIIRLQDPFNFLISDKLRMKLIEGKLTGWETYSVKADNRIKNYKGFQCVGKCGNPKNSNKTGFITGFEFDIKNWDGNDFFTPESTMMIICTEKAKNIIDELNIENIIFENLKSLRYYQL